MYQDDITVELEVVTCNADLDPSIEYAEDQVAIEVVAKNDSQRDCADGLTIELSEPLNGRALVDVFDGTVIATDYPDT